jgi:hypothetical protein
MPYLQIISMDSSKIGTYSPHANESQGMEETIVHTRNNVQTCNNNKEK